MIHRIPPCLSAINLYNYEPRELYHSVGHLTFLNDLFFLAINSTPLTHCPFFGLEMINKHIRILFTQSDPCSFEDVRRNGAWVMHVPFRQRGQLGAPLFNVLPLSIKLFALQRRVENPEIRRRVSPGPSHPLPADRIRRKIRIKKILPEVVLALPPINQQILDQIACSNHPDPIMHPPNTFQLSHPSINYRNSSPAIFPCLQHLTISISLPAHTIKFFLVVLLGLLGNIVQQIVTKFSPADLKKILLNAFFFLPFNLFHFGPSLVRAYLSEVVMGG